MLIPPVPFFFLKMALAIRGFLYFHTNCEIICSSSVKNTVGSLIGINRNKLETKKKEISENDYKKSPGFLYKFFVFSFVFSSLLWAAGESEDPYILKKQSMQSIQYLETYT